MQTVPKFEIYDEQKETEGVFDWGEDRNELFNRYYEAQDHFYMGDIDRSKKIVNDILNEDPHFIDGYTLLGDIELEMGNVEKALTHHKKALEIGEKIIPNSFEGKIRWGFTENRPFLRAIHSCAMDLLDQGDTEEATRLLERLLNYNPSDNQGIRLLIGDLYFTTGDTQKAEKIYKQNLDYPPYQYSYGLLQFSRENYGQAAKFFRLGLCSNIYISDLLRGKLPVIKYEIWHGTNFELPETAYSYLGTMVYKWAEFPEALNLLQFLHIAEPSRREIDQVYGLKQDLYYTDSGFDDFGAGFEDFEEPDPTSMREDMLSELEDIKNQIDDESSAKLAKQWQSSSFDIGDEWPLPDKF